MAAAEPGLADTWGSTPDVVRTLCAEGRVIVPAPTSKKKELKQDNKTAAFNKLVLQPVIECIALTPNWDLVKMPPLEKEFPR